MMLFLPSARITSVFKNRSVMKYWLNKKMPGRFCALNVSLYVVVTVQNCIYDY